MNLLKKFNIYFFINILIKFKIKFFKKNLLKNIYSTDYDINALVYFKTDIFFSNLILKMNTHPNNLEIKIICEALKDLKYNVYLLDRDAKIGEINEIKYKKFKLFISNASGNSAKFHNYIINNFFIKKKIIYAAGPEPHFSNELVEDRHKQFDKKNSCVSVRRRLVDVSQNRDRFKKIDSILYVGNKFSKSSYEKYQKPLNKILPIISFHNQISRKEIYNKERFNIVYVGGSGLICKGLDIVIDAFLKLPDFRLDIFGPSDEMDFWNIYQNKIKKKNIHFHGFVSPNSALFKNIIKKAAFHINCPSSEGMATSVLLTNSFGVIPVVSDSSGIDIEDFGFKVDNTKESIINMFEFIKDISKDEMFNRINLAIENSKKFNLNSYKKNFIFNISN
jgi:hypothetical protein